MVGGLYLYYIFSVGFNGSTYGYFKGMRGIRQRDPLSPYLRLLAMNYLSHALDKTALERRFAYHHKCRKTRPTHICFVDDLLIFKYGSPQSMASIIGGIEEL